MTDIRVTQVAVEEWAPTIPPQMRLTQAAIETWVSTANIGAARMDGAASFAAVGGVTAAVSAQMDGPTNVNFAGVARGSAIGVAQMDGEADIAFSGGLIYSPVPGVLPTRPRYVKHTWDDFYYAWNALLPLGEPLWVRDDGRVQMQINLGLARLWDDISGRSDILLVRESDPRSTVDMLVDWERNFGLPDPCVAEPIGFDQRRRALVAKMTLLGGQSREYFYGVAESLGYTVHIGEFAPFMTGVSHCGDTRGPVMNPDDPNQYRWWLGPPELRFYWTVHVQGLRLDYFRTGSSITGIDRLLRIGIATDLECVMRRYKPACLPVGARDQAR